MIRCTKCGFSNQLSAKFCVKCRSTLVHEEGVTPNPAEPTQPNRKTVVIRSTDEAPWDQVNAVPEQRYRANNGAQTVRRFVPDPTTCCLVAISDDEEKELRKIDLQNDPVPLDRAVLDPGNSSISRSGHASIYQRDGQWYIENMTPMKTTFVQVNRPVKLSDGDVILLGDSLFKFKMG